MIVIATCQIATAIETGPQMDPMTKIEYEPVHAISTTQFDLNWQRWVEELVAHNRYCKNPLFITDLSAE
ncbi:MAG: hypothetical protein Q8R28_16910 [Dehalococcoidia bacterium]|nr:hypothetical protein [Dehalococcoidia bacterium]